LNVAETGVRILLADDNEGIRSALRLVLDELSLPCTVVEAHDAEAVLEQLGLLPVDVVLLDWELPGLPPGQLLRKVKCRCPSCVVIAMSGRLEAREEAAQLGTDGFVSKNEPPDRLLQMLRVMQSRT
jgi:DNA-binding NarL/FixJ family response regulator